MARFCLAKLAPANFFFFFYSLLKLVAKIATAIRLHPLASSRKANQAATSPTEQCEKRARIIDYDEEMSIFSETRIKLPNPQNGIWPAFWMLGGRRKRKKKIAYSPKFSVSSEGSWPQSGEIDILEAGSANAIGANVVNKRVGGTTHWAGGDYGLKNIEVDSLGDWYVYKTT